MKKNCLILLLLTLTAILGYIAVQRNNELKTFKAQSIKVMDCRHQHDDELLKLWCTANNSFEHSTYAHDEKNKTLYINGWFHTLNALVQSYPTENIDTTQLALSPIWKAAGYQSRQLLAKQYDGTVRVLYNNPLFTHVTGQLKQSYNKAEFTDNSLISKSQYTVGYLVGRLYGMEKPHRLSALNENNADVMQYSKQISQSLINNDGQSDYFNQGLIDGTTLSVQKLSREIKSSLD